MKPQKGISRILTKSSCQTIFPNKNSEMPSISDFQNIHETSSGVSKKMLRRKNFPPHPPPLLHLCSEYLKKLFFFEKKNCLFMLIWGKIIILIEMFRGTMGLSTWIFTKFFIPRGEGVTDLRKLWTAVVADPKEAREFFLAKICILIIIIFEN